MRYQVQENCLTIYLPREVDHHNADEIRKEADAVISRNHIRYVIFDFDRTDFMDSSGIGIIMGRYKTVSLIGGEVWAVHTNERIRKILTFQEQQRLCRFMRGRLMEASNTQNNEMEIRFDSRSENEGFARVSVASF